MENDLFTEKMLTNIPSPLPKWIIEYAFTKRMIDVLEVLGPPPWFKGDWGCRTPKDPCGIRVAAAEAWMIIRTRQVQHFEKVLELMDHFYTLLPHLVTPIKHMKIMFGLKTLVIMWMFGDEQSLSDINHKILRFFPDSLTQYHKSSRRHMKLMQKTQKDFRKFAQSLARNGEWRKTYIQDLMKDQYGELYTIKLEERLLYYLDLLNKALLQPTYIDRVLNQSCPLEGSDELLQQLLTCDDASQSKALKRLLKCVLMSDSDESVTTKQHKNATDVHSNSSLEKTERSSLMKLDEGERSMSKRLEKQTEGKIVGKENNSPVASSSSKLCSRHGKKMKSILQECSEELRVQDGEGDLMQTAETLAETSHPKLTQDSASSLEDSSSTNISRSSNLDCFSNLDDGQKLLSSDSSSQPETSPSSRVQSKSSVSSTHKPNAGFLTQVSFSSTSSRVTPLSGCSPLPFSSSSSSASFPKNQMTQVARSPSASPTSPPEKDSFTVPLSQHHISPLESSSASLMPMEILSRISTQVSQPNRHRVVSESSDDVKSKLKLSLETQSYLLLCKWLQPRVKLYRLRDCDRPTGQPPTENDDDDDEEKFFDVNFLYSDSESDTQDSDDPDYQPSKKTKL